MFGFEWRLLPMMDAGGEGSGFPDAPADSVDDEDAIPPGAEGEGEGNVQEPTPDDGDQQDGQQDDQQQGVYRTQEEFDAALERRIMRERRAFERHLRDATAPYESLTQVMRQYGGIQGETPEDLAEGLKKFYKESGADIPDAPPAPTIPTEDAVLLAEVKADKFLKDAGLDDIRYEIRRLESLPEKRRTMQDAVMYKRLTAVLNDFRGVAEFKQRYPKTDLNQLLQDQDFAEFVSMTAPELPIAAKYAKYQALTAKKAAAPPSTGSVKAKGGTQDQTHFTPDDVEKMSPEEVRKNFDAINKSRLEWK